MSTAAKRELTQVKVSVDSEIASAFKRVCAASNVSMAAELSMFMSEYSKGLVKRKAAPNYSTRRRRRTAIKALLVQLELIRCCEERVRDNTPENLQSSEAYEATEDAVSSLDEAIDALTEFWMVP
jgi:hypothetical protein